VPPVASEAAVTNAAASATDNGMKFDVALLTFASFVVVWWCHLSRTLWLYRGADLACSINGIYAVA
jgi:hypothetical protein